MCSFNLISYCICLPVIGYLSLFRWLHIHTYASLKISQSTNNNLLTWGLVVAFRTLYPHVLGRSKTVLQCSGRNVNKCTTTLTHVTPLTAAMCYLRDVVCCGLQYTTETVFTWAHVCTTMTKVTRAGQLPNDCLIWRRSCRYLPSVQSHLDYTTTTGY